MEREALKLALITLEGWDNHDKWVWPETALEQVKRNTKEAITAIKEALAQPAQEPLAWMCSAFDGEPCEQTNHDECGNPIPLYTAPPQPAQELVGWADLQKKAQQIVESKFLWKRFIDGTPLANDIACWMADFARQYTAPPQRTWVGLTDEQQEEMYQMTDNIADCRTCYFKGIADAEAAHNIGTAP